MALVALKDVSVAFGGLQQALEAEGGWELKRRVESILGRTRLDGERPFETLEEEQSRLYALMADPGFYRQEGPPIARARARLEATARELEDTYRRWETLDALSNPDAGPPPPQ